MFFFFYENSNPPVANSISTAAQRRVSTCLGSCPEIRRRCTTRARRSVGCRIPVRSVSVWNTVRLTRGCNGTFPKTTRRWRGENWTRRPANAVCRPAFSTAVESRASCPKNTTSSYNISERINFFRENKFFFQA